MKAIWGWFPLLLVAMIPVRTQWGRYNLPRYLKWKDVSRLCFNKRCLTNATSVGFTVPLQRSDDWKSTPHYFNEKALLVYAVFNENSNKFRNELQCSTTCLQCSIEKSDIFLKHGGAFLQENATLLCMKWVLKGFLFQGILHSLFARTVLLFLKKYCKKWCYASTLLSEYTVPHPFRDFFWNSNFPKYYCIYWGVITSLTFHQKTSASC